MGIAKPRIVFYSSVALEPWDWTNPWTKGIGGSETSHIELAERLGKLDIYQVESYAPVPWLLSRPHDNVVWRPTKYAEFDSGEPAIWLIYRDPTFFDRELRTDSRYAFISQDVDYDWTPERLAKVHRYICLCQEHVDYTLAKYPVLRGRVYLSTNGVRSDYLDRHFRELDNGAIEDQIVGINAPLVHNPHRLFYASSPDRGLLLILQNWSRIRARVTDAELRIAYGFDNMERLLERGAMNHLLAQKPEIEALLNQDGITWLGRLNQHDVYREWFQAGIFFYPNDFCETSCISVMDAQACGAIPVTNALWALKQNVLHGVLIDGVPQEDPICRAVMIHELCDLMLDEERQAEIRAEMMKDARDSFDWSKVSQQWARWIDSDWASINA